MIDPRVVRILIEAGSLPDPESIDALLLLDLIREHDEINRLAWNGWDPITKTLSTEELISLIKALTIAEFRFSWTGGSVSAIIWTFRELQRRQSDQTENLADWILHRTSNQYVPFGTTNHGAKSLIEYKKRLRDHAEFLQQSHLRAEAEIIEAKQRKIDNKIRAEARVASQRKANEIRLKYLEGLSNKSASERLKLISQDIDHSIDYYPIEFSQISDSDLERLDIETRHLLKEKLSPRKKGPWKSLYNRIMMIEGGKSG